MSNQGYLFSPPMKMLFCDFMGWHRTPERIGFDGVNKRGHCPRCQRPVLLDSQGNWFAIGKPHPTAGD